MLLKYLCYINRKLRKRNFIRKQENEILKKIVKSKTVKGTTG